MTDEQKALVERLRGHSKIMARDKGKFVRFIDVATCNEAADLIDEMEAENARLREALFPFAEQAYHYEPEEDDGGEEAFLSRFLIRHLRAARAALAQETQP